MKMHEGTDLYFAAIIPPPGLYEKIQQLKEYVHEKYKSRSALNSPPHATVFMPFRWKTRKENELISTTKKVAASHKPFSIQLENFDVFKPRVIFINIAPSEELHLLQKSLVREFKRELQLFDPGLDKRPFHPHITIAFRDLKKSMFNLAWNDDFSKRIFNESFEVRELNLLKHNGKFWEVWQTFPLES